MFINHLIGDKSRLNKPLLGLWCLIALLISCAGFQTPTPLPPAPPPTETPLPTPTPEPEVDFSLLITEFRHVSIASWRATLSGPFMHVVENEEQLQQVDFVSIEAFKRLAGLDLNENIALIIYQGEQPSSGYVIETERIMLKGDEAHVFVHFKSAFEVQGAVTMAATYPHQIVTVPKAQIPSHIQKFVLIANDEIITATNPEEAERLPFYIHEKEIPFSILATEDDMANFPGAANYGEEFTLGAFMYMVTSQDQIGEIDFVSPQAIDLLSDLDYAEQIAVIIHQGRQSTPGVGVETKGIFTSGYEIVVAAHFRPLAYPGETQPLPSSITYPYQIITAQKRDIEVFRDIEAFDVGDFILVANTSGIIASTPEESVPWIIGDHP